MRQAFIKEIRELEELEIDCLLANHDVQREIVAFANESSTQWLDEILYCISDSLSDYSISEPFNSYIRVKDYYSFYNGIIKMEDWYGVFNSTDIIERLGNVYETHYTTSDADVFEKHMKPLERDIASILGSYGNYYTSYEELEYETDFILSWLEGNYDKECVVDGGRVTLLNY